MVQYLVELKKGFIGPLLVDQKMMDASHYLQKLTPSDDAYLTTFERVDFWKGWQKDYKKLKAEILACMGVTIAVHAQQASVIV